jgi:XTP/dITP diphosphohydrolase
MITLLIGSNNPGKVQEIREILAGGDFPARILTPSEARGFPTEIAETGATLEENAYLKAHAIFSQTLRACVADDTGLEVDALGGAPGVRSARYAGERASDAENRAKLLEALRGVPEEERGAQFRTVVCYMDAFRTAFAEGVARGRIAESERGTGGFGYDALFIPEGETRTFAEMSADEKHHLSHRGRSLAALVELLRGYYAEE